MTGWECPRCHRCYSPSTSQCASCGPSEATAPVVPSPFVVPSTFKPMRCFHLRREQSTAGARCLDCGVSIAPYTFRVVPMTADGVTSTGAVTYCQHGRRWALGSCRDCHASYTSGGAS